MMPNDDQTDIAPTSTETKNWETKSKDEFLPSSIQESIITCLVFITDEHTTKMAQMIDLNWFDDPYRHIAALCQEYWTTYEKAPGMAHVDDRFSHILGNPDHKENHLYNRLLRGMMSISGQVNTRYMESSLYRFAVRQTFKRGIMESGVVLAQAGDFYSEREFDKIETAWNKATQFRERFANRQKLCRTVLEWMDLEITPSHKLLGGISLRRAAAP